MEGFSVPDGAGPVGIVIVTLIGVCVNMYTAHRNRQWAQIDADKKRAEDLAARQLERDEDERKRLARVEEIRLEIKLRAEEFERELARARVAAEQAAQKADKAFTKANDTNGKIIQTNEHLLATNQQITTLAERFAQLLEREGQDRAIVRAERDQDVRDRAAVADLAAADRIDRATVADLVADVAAHQQQAVRDRAEVADLAASDRKDRAEVARRVERLQAAHAAGEAVRDEDLSINLALAEDTNARMQQIVSQTGPATGQTVGEQIAETNDLSKKMADRVIPPEETQP